jgi:hypothetical protein
LQKKLEFLRIKVVVVLGDMEVVVQVVMVDQEALVVLVDMGDKAPHLEHMEGPAGQLLKDGAMPTNNGATLPQTKISKL